MLEKMVLRLNCINTLGTNTFSLLAFFNCSVFFCIWRHNDLGVVVEGYNQQRPHVLSILEYPFLVLVIAQ